MSAPIIQFLFSDLTKKLHFKIYFMMVLVMGVSQEIIDSITKSNLNVKD